MWYVYIHFKPNGRPFYVGKGLINRVKTLARPHNDMHCKIVKKYGPENIRVMLSRFETNAEAVAEEIRLIAELRAFGVPLANMTDGGDGTPGFKRTPEQCRANGERKIGNQYMKGKKLSEEAKMKISLSNLGKKRDEAFRAKRSQAMKEYFSDPKNRERQSIIARNRKHTDETREKMRKERSGLKWITNGTVDMHLLRGEKMPDGWSFGRSAVWITDGSSNKMAYRWEELPVGWRFGRTVKK